MPHMVVMLLSLILFGIYSWMMWKLGKASTENKYLKERQKKRRRILEDRQQDEEDYSGMSESERDEFLHK